MNKMLSLLVTVLSLALHTPFAEATACAGCQGTCQGSSTANCGCVKIEGCVCCGGTTSSIAAASGNSAAKMCVKDDKKANPLRRTHPDVRKAGKEQQELKVAPK